VTPARRTILCVFAHPDDESMGPGATLAKLSRAGHRVLFVTATLGGAGRLFDERPGTPEGRERLMAKRREETAAAAKILGLEHLGFLGWEDQGLAALDPLFVEETIARFVRRTTPDVLLTFHGSGISYHADHRVLTLATMGAFLGSGHADWYRDEELRALPPHAPRKLYAYVPNGAAPYWKDWPRTVYRAAPTEITAVIDTSATADAKWDAVRAHESQSGGPPFRALYEAGAFREESFVRIFPSPRPGDAVETDLLDGLD